VTERTELILYLSFATFCIVVFIAVLLVKRHGHTIETEVIRHDIAGVRQQMSAENGALQDDLKTTKTWVGKLLDRWGFLK
jgi:hypothetical protein